MSISAFKTCDIELAYIGEGFVVKVLIVNRYMGLYGGAETVVKELAGGLDKIGAEVRVVTLNISQEVRRLMPDTQVVLPPRHMPYALRSVNLRSSLGILDEIRQLRLLVKKHATDFDLINVHNFPASWICSGLNKPVVWMCNEVPDFYNNPHPGVIMRLLRSLGVRIDIRRVTSDIDIIVCADNYNAERVRQRYCRESKIIPYGIEYDFFSKSEGVQVPIKSGPDDFLLVQSGMLTPEKNQLASIQAVEQLRAKIPGIKLVLAGRDDTPYAGSLKEYVAKKGLAEVVSFTGHVAKHDIRRFYHACKIALFPVKSQGGWLSPFEALCAGKPVVTSTTMGAASVIKEHNLGTATDDLAGAVAAIYNSYQKYLDQAISARVWVREHLTWDIFCGRMLEAFEQAIAKRRHK